MTLQIIGERYSRVQNADKTLIPDFETCKMIVDIPLAERTNSKRGLFWHLFHTDLRDHWYDDMWRPEEYEQMPKRTQYASVDEHPLRIVGSLDLSELAAEFDEVIPEDVVINYARPTWPPNLILMRFCVICSDTATLQKAFESSLSCMK